jgi:hypothetical protein
VTGSAPRLTGAFEIVPSSSVVHLDANRGGRVSCTVRNVSGRLLHCRVDVIAAGGTEKGWFSVAGPAVEEVPDQASWTVEVSVRVPATTPAPMGSFRLRAVGVENPDEYSAAGPEITFEVSPPPFGKAVGKGYVETLVGAVAGGLVGLLIGTIPGSLFLLAALHAPVPSRPGQSVSAAIGAALGAALGTALMAAFFFLAGTVIGIWAGPVIGAWLALRIRDRPRRALTVTLLAVILPVWAVLVIVLLGVIFSKVSGGLALLPVVLALALILCVPPLAARRLALLRERSAL